MPSRDQVTSLLEQGHSYETAGRALGIPAGRAALIATGEPSELDNPPSHNPTRNPRVMAWVRERAARDLTRDPGA
jgi:hypothetical protein